MSTVRKVKRTEISKQLRTVHRRCYVLNKLEKCFNRGKNPAVGWGGRLPGRVIAQPSIKRELEFVHQEEACEMFRVLRTALLPILQLKIVRPGMVL